MFRGGTYRKSNTFWVYEVSKLKKKIILRSIFGLPTGITIGHLITLCISLGWGDGHFYPCVPELVDIMGSELRAVLLQTALYGVLGMAFAASSVIWEIERWSLVKQTGVYFLILSVVFMPIAYFTYWMEHSFVGFLSYFGVFAVLFAVIWLIQYAVGRRVVKKMNAKLK